MANLVYFTGKIALVDNLSIEDCMAIQEPLNKLAEYERLDNEGLLLKSQEPIDDWIPCSSGLLPEEHDSIFAKLKGTDRWKTGMFEKISDEVYVTVVDEKGNRATDHAHTVDGKWSCDLLKCNKSYRVIAWRPLPEPYSGSE